MCEENFTFASDNGILAGAASIVLTAFVSALTDAEKKYAADLARALNG